MKGCTFFWWFLRASWARRGTETPVQNLEKYYFTSRAGAFSFRPNLDRRLPAAPLWNRKGKNAANRWLRPMTHSADLSPIPPRDRKGRVFHLIDRSRLGLEIGPSYSPFAPRSEGFKVEIVDHLDTENLRKKYNHNPRIEDVDYVFDGRSLVELIGAEGRYSWVIASHVIEHVPDVIAFLRDCERLIDASGVVSLVVPDKRYCFDHFRPHTDVSVAVNAHLERRTMPSPGVVAAGLLYNVFNSGKHSFTEENRGEFQLRFNAGQAKALMEAAKSVYKDCHVWCFTPASFRLLILDLQALGFISLREAAFFPTGRNGSEFYITLKKGHTEETVSREMLLTDLEDEILMSASAKPAFGARLSP